MAQTTVSGRLFENSLREMVKTLVWHNKYLGDKYDSESRYVNAVEVDTYLTGARHLLMANSQDTLEAVENMSNEEYETYRNGLINTANNTSLKDTTLDLHREIVYWDMFFYGRKLFNDGGEYPYLPTSELKDIPKYTEKNTYYRELYGLPEYVGKTCYCRNCHHIEKNMTVCPVCGSTGYLDGTNTKVIDTDHDAPSKYSYIAQFPLDYTKSVQPEYGKVDNEGREVYYNPLVFLYEQPLATRWYAEFTTTFVNDIKEQVKDDRHYKYLSHMTNMKIHPFVARLSDRYEILYMADADISFLNKDFREVYEKCRLFMKYRYYTEAFRNQYNEYEGFIGMAIMFMALQRMQSKYLEADITRDFYDLESIEVVYNAYSVPFYSDIPLAYHTKIIKAINRLLAIKGTNKCFREIFDIFGYSTINMYQYYILKTQKRDAQGNPVFGYNLDGTERAEDMYDVRIVKADIGENPYNYILDSLNYLDYYGVTEPDTYWLNDEDLLYKLYHSDYNFIETKYIGIEMAFSLTRLTIETEYLMRMLLDNRFSGNDGTSNITVYHGKIGKDIDLYTLVIYIMYIIGTELGLENGGSIDIFSDPAKLSAIYGFNFIEDFYLVFGYLARKFIYNYRSGYSFSDTETYVEDGVTKTRTVVMFVPTDYSNIDIDEPIPDVPYSEYRDYTIKQVMDMEADLNSLDINEDNYQAYRDAIKVNMPLEYVYDVLDNPNGIKYQLVYALNDIRRLLTTYTTDEIELKDILSVKFVSLYWSDDVCAYCGFARQDDEDVPYTYCHSELCISHHEYSDGKHGPTLRDRKGNIPDTMDIDTSKDTEFQQFRNVVYSDFMKNFTKLNPLIRKVIENFDPYTSITVSKESGEEGPGHIYASTFNIDDTLTVNALALEAENTDFVYVDSYYYDNLMELTHEGDNATLTIEYYDGDVSKTKIIETQMLYVDPTLIPMESDETYIRIYLNTTFDVPASTDSISIAIKYREIDISFGEWNDIMTAGITAKYYVNKAKEYYDSIVKAREEDPESYTIYQENAAYNRYNEGIDAYQGTMYYLLLTLSTFIDNIDDIDLDSEEYIWKWHDWEPKPEEEGEEPIPIPVRTDTIKDILETMSMYMPLIGLRSKREFRLFISGQMDELTPIVCERVSDSDAIPADDSGYSYIPPYYSKLRNIYLTKIYTDYYFLKYDPQNKSRLVDVIDKFYLEDHDKYIADYKYGVVDNIETTPSITYMDEPIRSKDIQKYYDDNGNEVVEYTKLFDYLKNHIRAILDQSDTSMKQNEHEMMIGKGKPVNKDWNRIQESYKSIAELYDEFIVLTWNARDPRTYYAVRRLNKMLMTTRYSRNAYKLGPNNDNSGNVAQNYKELLNSLDPELVTRVDNMMEDQLITELEYALDMLSKCSDDLIYIHAYGGFNMKRIISYIFKMILFFKSAKVDLLDYGLEFRIDSKTDNMIKYMSSLTKLSTDSTISPDQWKIVDFMKEHERWIRLNIEKTDKITFTDVCIHDKLGSNTEYQSALYLMPQISKRLTNPIEDIVTPYETYPYNERRYYDEDDKIITVPIDIKLKASAMLEMQLRDYFKHDQSINHIDCRRMIHLAYEKYLTIMNDRIDNPDDTIYTQKDETNVYEAYLAALEVYDIKSSKDKNIILTDNLVLGRRVKYSLDFNATPTKDEYDNDIYPFLYDENGLKVKEVYNIM